MKRLVVTNQKDCMACYACEIACSTAFYKDENFEKSCIHIVADKDGHAKTNVCIQCGKCMRTCKQGAITQNPKSGVYMINKKLCNGCGECVEACPMHVMVKTPDIETTSKCIACGICAKACPMMILAIEEK